MQTEITNPQKLLDEQGRLQNPGWARQPYWKYGRKDIRAPKWRIKEWDYYLVTNDSYGVAFTLSDLGYSGMASVSFLNYQEGWEHTETVFTPLPLGRFALGSYSGNGNAEFQSKNMELKYITNPGTRRILCHVSGFRKGRSLDAELELDQPHSDSMCIATPWKKKPKAFYYNQKINCLPAEGRVSLGNDAYHFSRERDFGVLDWGRGVWTYDNTWYWGTGSGLVDQVPFGFNLGYGFSDRSAATENTLFYDGAAHKLDQVAFRIPKAPDGSPEYMGAWKIASDEERLKGTFTPILHRKADLNALVIATNQDQLFGYFNGRAELDDGLELSLVNFFCVFEVVHNRY